MEITPESIRKVVLEEQYQRFESIERTLEKMANSCEKLAQSTAESIAEHKVNNEKFKQINYRFDHQDERINEVTKNINLVSTKIIPEMQKTVLQNSLTAKVFWKFLLIAGTPVCGGIASILFVFQKAQQSSNAELAKILTKLATTTMGVN